MHARAVESHDFEDAWANERMKLANVSERDNESERHSLGVEKGMVQNEC